MIRSRGNIFVLATTVLLQGLLGMGELAWPQGQVVTFSVIGDAPYGDDEVAVVQEHMNNHNLYSPSDFLVHVGDIKSGSSSCVESHYIQMADILKSLAVPAFIIPGDNEWVDCSDPDQAWSFWTKHLLAIETHFCGTPAVARQTTWRENFAFVHKGVLFIGINLVSGNSDATLMQANADWVSQHFQNYGPQVRAAVVFAQASPNSQFVGPFRTAASAFGKPILYIHGDGHGWEYEPAFEAPNILRVQVPRGNDPPVQVTVTLNTLNTLNTFLFDLDPWPNGTEPFNKAPCVDSGPDQTITLGSVANLHGMVTDDGVPTSPGSLTTTWSKVSGPGAVSFGNLASPDTTASLSDAGTYQLLLTAYDGELWGSDELLVEVLAEGNPPTNYTLTTNTIGLGSVTLDPAGGVYAESTVVTLTATAGAGWTFGGWSGALSGTANPAVLTMDADKSVTATFTQLPPEGNQAPTVDAGADQTLTLSNQAVLRGTVWDDGQPNPPGQLITTWRQVSGPGVVTFADIYAVETTASFSQAGTYAVALTADDSALTTSDTVTLVVQAPEGTVTTVEVRVAAKADDAEESASGTVTTSSSDLELVREKDNQTVGVRFGGVTIPRGATIVTAYVQFQVDETSSEVTALTLAGEASDNAPSFTTATRSISSRIRTAAAVTWSPEAWPTVGETGTTQRTPDIAAVVQAIVNRPGWSPGNALALLITGTGRRVAKSYDGNPAGAPLLHVEYTEGSTPPVGNQAPTVDAGADQTLTLPARAALDGTVWDDGLPNPPGQVSTTWRQVSGPEGATFTDAQAVDTTASFSAAGTYVLELSATDGTLSASDTVTIVVQAPGGSVTIVERRIAAKADDAEEKASGSTDLSSTDLDLGEKAVGVRFPLPVPTGATIVAAYVQFTADGSSTQATTVTIRGEASANALPFTSKSRNITNRPRTTAAVTWAPAAWTTAAAAELAQRTPDLTTVLQEVVNQPGWVSGNAVGLILTGSGAHAAVSYNGNQAKAPLLHVEYR